MDNVRQHEIEITGYALDELKKIEGLTVYGPSPVQERGGVIAFNVKGIHPHDLAQILDSDNICIRSGHHCAMPLHARLNIHSSARASFYIYNSIFSPEVFPLDRAIFSGYISRERMVHEHPRELAELEGKPLEEIMSHHLDSAYSETTHE